MAFVLADGYIYLSYGSQDSNGWIAKLDYKALLDSLLVIKVGGGKVGGGNVGGGNVGGNHSTLSPISRGVR